MLRLIVMSLGYTCASHLHSYEERIGRSAVYLVRNTASSKKNMLVIITLKTVTVNNKGLSLGFSPPHWAGFLRFSLQLSVTSMLWGFNPATRVPGAHTELSMPNMSPLPPPKCKSLHCRILLCIPVNVTCSVLDTRPAPLKHRCFYLSNKAFTSFLPFLIPTALIPTTYHTCFICPTWPLNSYCPGLSSKDLEFPSPWV